MECSEPGGVRDEELASYLAGEQVRPAVVQHIEGCPACSSQVTLYRCIELRLTSRLYRWDCPPHRVLGEYHLGLLDKERASEVKKHLDECVLCAEELATFVQLLADTHELAAIDGPWNL
ncbi:MAG TPA: hypothetical protein VKR06_06860 [Ktedonosporobacter sp.]|nr:hypothetical protein [Ktedonosporobacter sp.]